MCSTDWGRKHRFCLPDLTEPWQVISTSETLGAKAEITVIAHTSFAKAATSAPANLRIDQSAAD